MNRQLAVLLVALLLPCSPLMADEDEPDLRLNQIKSIQVSGSLTAPPNLGLSLETLTEPFRALLVQRGVKIDQNNYDNVISTEAEVAWATVGGTTVYAVSLSFHYTEPCSSSRLNLHTTCALWEHYEVLQTFADPGAVEHYVMNTVALQAKRFVAQFGRR